MRHTIKSSTETSLVLGRDITGACHIYLIPLKKHPIFKLGNAFDLNSRMKGIGIVGHADKKRIIAIQLPDKKTAETLEKSIGRLLRPYRTNNVPAEIMSGRTEFFSIDAWDSALELIVNLRKYGWDYSIVTWSKTVKARPVKVVRPLSPATLVRNSLKVRKEKIWQRYNSLIFSRFWIRLLKMYELSLVGLKFSTNISEMETYCPDLRKTLQLIRNDATGTYEEKLPYLRFYADLCVTSGSPRWVLIYKDPSGVVYDALNGRIREGGVTKIIKVPSVKFAGGVNLFIRRSCVGDITVLDVDPSVFVQSGTERLLALFQEYDHNFPNTTVFDC